MSKNTEDIILNFDGWLGAQSPAVRHGIDAHLKASGPNADRERRRLASMNLVAEETGLDLTTVNERWDTIRGGYAEAMAENTYGRMGDESGGEWMAVRDDEAAFHAKLVHHAQLRKDERFLLQGPDGVPEDEAGSAGRLNSLAGVVSAAALNGQPYTDAWAAWQKDAAAKPGYDAGRLTDYEAAARKIHADMSARVAEVKPAVESMMTGLMAERDGTGAAYGTKELVDQMAALTPDQRRLAQAMLATRAAAEGKKKEAGGQMMQAIGRGSASLMTGSARTVEAGTLAEADKRLAELKPGDTIGGRFEDLYKFARGESADSTEGQVLGFLLEPILADKVVTQEEIDTAKARVAQERDRMQIQIDLEQTGKAALDPIKGANFITNRIIYPFAESILPQIGLAMLTRRIAPVGTGLTGALASSAGASLPMWGMMADQNAQQLMQQNPAMNLAQAYEIGREAAVAQTGLEYVQIMLGMGTLPKLGTALRTMRAGAWKTAGKAFVAGMVGQNLIEGSQDIMAPVFQALTEEAPGVNWDVVFNGRAPEVTVRTVGSGDGAKNIYTAGGKDWQTPEEAQAYAAENKLGGYWSERVDTALALLPMVILGTGGTVLRNKIGAAQLERVAAGMTDMNLHAAGIGAEQRSAILAEPDAEARLDAFSTALETADKATAAEGAKRMQDEIKAQMNAITASMKEAGITWEHAMVNGESVYRVVRGETTTEHATAADSLAAVRDHFSAQDQEQNGPLLEMLDELDKNRLSPVQQMEVTIIPRQKVSEYQAERAAIMQDDSAAPEVRDRAQAESESMGRRQKAFEAQYPDKKIDWRKIDVGGQSELEVKEGVARAVLRVANGESAYTVFEEKVETEPRAWIGSMQMTWEKLERDLRQVEAATLDTYINGHTGGVDVEQDRLSLIEAYSELAQVHATQKGRAGKDAATGIAQVARMDRKGARMNLRQAMATGNVSAELMGRLKAHVEWLKTVVGKAINLQRARKKAGGRFDIDEYLNKSIGLEEDAAHAEGVVAEADLIYNPPTPEQEADGIAFNLKAMDADYMAAVNAGDVAKQQEMVNTAAKAAGYSWAGLKHGSGARFLKFLKEFRGSAAGGVSANEAFFLTDSDRTAEAYARYAAVDGPVRRIMRQADEAERKGRWDEYERLLTQAEDMTYGEEGAKAQEERGKNAVVYSLFAKGNFLEVDAGGLSAEAFGSLTAMIDRARRQNLDGVIFRNLDDAPNLNDPATHFAVFNSNQIKSADPITYDEFGNVIPLSQRFNPASDLISFSLSYKRDAEASDAESPYKDRSGEEQGEPLTPTEFIEGIEDEPGTLGGFEIDDDKWDAAGGVGFNLHKVAPEVPVIPFNSLKGKRKFVFFADRMRVGMYTGLDPESGISIALQGGAGYPFTLGNIEKGAGWAFSNLAMFTRFLKRVKLTDGIGVVTLYNKENLRANATFLEAYFAEVEYAIATNKLDRVRFLQEANRLREATLNLKKDGKAIGDGTAAWLPQWRNDWTTANEAKAALGASTFEIRGGAFFGYDPAKPRGSRGAKISSKTLVGAGFPNIDLMIDLMADPEFEGLDQGTMVAAIQFDQDQTGASDAKSLGVDPHLSYPVIIKGKGLGYLDKRVSAETVLKTSKEGRAALRSAETSMAGVTFRLRPVETLDKLADQMAKQTRDPEARRKVYDQMSKALETLRTRWTETTQRWNGESRPLVERRTPKELSKEQAFREAAAFADAEELIMAGLSRSAQAALGMTQDDTSAYQGPLAQRFTGGRFGTSGRIQSRKDAMANADAQDFKMGGEMDGAAGLPPMWFGGSLTADNAAQEAYDAGEINEATADALWEAMRKELRTQAKNKEALAAAMTTLKDGQKAARAKAKEEAAAWRAEQEAMQQQDWDPRALMLRHLRTLDAILSALPPEVRAKVGGWTAVASLKTQGAMQKELERRLTVAEEELELALQKDARNDIQAVLDSAKAKVGENRIAKGRLTIETQAILDKVRVYASMSLAEAQAALVLAQGAIDTAADEAALTKAWDEYLTLETTGALFDDSKGGKTAAELTDALDFIEQAYVKGRTGYAVLAEANKVLWDSWRGAVIDKNGPATSDQAADRIIADKRTGISLLRAGEQLIEAQFNIHQQLIDLLGEDHPVTQHFSRTIRHARETARMEAHQEGQALYQWLRDKLGVKSKARQAILIGKLSESVESPVLRVVGRKTVTDEISIELARQITDGSVQDPRYPLASGQAKQLGEMLRVYDAALAAWDAKPGGRRPERKYLEVDRITDPGVSSRRKMSQLEAINDTLLWQQERYQESSMERHGLGKDYIAQVEGWLSPEAKVIREFIRSRYGSEYDGMNKTFKTLFNMNMPQEKNYARAGFITPGMDMEAMGPDGLPSSPGGASIGSIKGRMAHKAEPKRQNALTLRMSHVAQISHWKAAAVTARDLRAVFSPIEVRNSIVARHGEQAYNRLLLAIKTFEGGGWREAMANLDGHAVIQRLIGTGVANSLAYNLGSIAAQVPASVVAMTKLGPAAWGKAAAQLVANPSLIAEVYRDAAIVLRRGPVFSGGQVFTMLTGQRGNMAAQAIVRIGEIGTELLGDADAALTSFSGAISYLAHLEDAKAAGMGDVEAQRVAKDLMRQTIEETAQPGDFARKSNFENQVSGATGLGAIAFRTLFMFKGAARAASANIFQTIKQAYRGEITPAQAGGRLAALLILVPLLEQAMRSAWRDLSSDDPDDELWRKPSTWIAAMVSAPAAGVPVLGSLQDLIKVKTIGGFAVTVQDPGTRLVSEAITFAGKAVNGEGLDINEVNAALHLTALGLTLLGAPGGEAIEGLLNITKAGAGMVENAAVPEADKNEAYQDKKARAEKAKQRKQDRAAKP